MPAMVDRIVYDQRLPERTDVVVVGGGIIGVSTALSLAEKGIRVLLCEKGDIGAEQSSRNWGWCRTMGRDPAEIPLSLESLRLWRGMNARVGSETGFRQAGTLYTCETPAEMEERQKWLDQAQLYQVDTRLIDAEETASLLPGTRRRWAGALYTPSDGRAEPQRAAAAMAAAAQRLGVEIIGQCAVRGIESQGGRVCAVVTERGRVACASVVLAGGAWSRLFCGNLGIDLPQLKILSSVMRTDPIDGPTDLAVGASDFAFRKRLDGGYTVARRGRSIAELTPDSFRLLPQFWSGWRGESGEVKLRLTRRFFDEWRMQRRWSLDSVTPFEQIRVLDPKPTQWIIDEAWNRLVSAFPVFGRTRVAETWAGLIDVTPDAVPVISDVPALPGFHIATGFSGHGFGIGPGAGRLMADLVAGDAPVVDPAPFRLARFSGIKKGLPS